MIEYPRWVPRKRQYELVRLTPGNTHGAAMRWDHGRRHGLFVGGSNELSGEHAGHGIDAGGDLGFDGMGERENEHKVITRRRGERGEKVKYGA